jgi:hypothetical protein
MRSLELGQFLPREQCCDSGGGRRARLRWRQFGILHNTADLVKGRDCEFTSAMTLVLCEFVSEFRRTRCVPTFVQSAAFPRSLETRC